MHILFSALVEELRRRVGVQGYHVGEVGYLSGVALFPRRFIPGQTTLDTDTLYICDYRDLRLQEPTLELPPLLCVVEPGVSVDEVFFLGRSIAVVHGKTQAEVLLLLSEMLYNYGCSSSTLTDLTHRFLCCQSVFDLMEAGYEALGNPLLLTDSNMRVIAFTDPHMISAPSYHTLVGQSHLPAGLPDSTSAGIAGGPVQVLDGVAAAGLPEGYCMALTVRGKAVGYLHLSAFNRPVVPKDAQILTLLGNLLSVELWHRPSQQDNTLTAEQEHLIREILDNSAGNLLQVQAAQARLDMKLNPHLYAIVVQLQNTQIVPHESFYNLAKLFAAQFPHAFGLFHRSSILLLIDTPEELVNPASVLTPLQPLLEQYKLVAGMSNAFPSLHQLRGFAFQARKAIQLGQRLHPEQTVFLFKDYSIYFMLELSLQHETLETFCSPELLRLSQNSLETGNDLLETLRVYLKCGRNKALTARELFVHVSTVKYRMTQIQEIMGLDLDDDDNALKLMLSFKLLEYQQVFQRSEPTEEFWKV